MKFTLSGRPTTKKTSLRVIKIPGKMDPTTHERGRGFTKILPSEQFEVWEKAILQQLPIVRSVFATAGVRIPYRGNVRVKALFFRQRDSGDTLGFFQALADVLQAPTWRYTCAACGKGTIIEIPKPEVTCNHCGIVIRSAPKQARKGLGIISDDEQIKSWDGSRLMKDADRPRVEITIEEFLEEPLQTGMFEDAIELQAPVKPLVVKRAAAVAQIRKSMEDDDPDW